jgi:large subunit ribosomal protein L6
MSRVGKQPIGLSSDVKIKFDKPMISVEGPKGKQQHEVPEEIILDISDKEIVVTRINEERKARSLHGLTRTLLANMVEGVTKGFKKELEIVGVGYRAEKSGKTLKLTVGFSHTIEYAEPEGITINVDKQVVSVEGVDKCLVGQIAAKIRSFRKPDVYKGKGIKYVGEVLIRKAGKVGAK